MWNALQQLEREGVIGRSSNGRSYMPAGTMVRQYPSIPASPAPKWKRIRDTIERNILAGLYKRGEPLPAVNELRARLGVSFVTLKKALRSLVDAGELNEHGRSYVATSLSGGRYRSVVCMVLPGDSSGEPRLYPRLQETIASIEQQCARSNLSLEIFAYHRRSHMKFAGLVASQRINLGYIVWIGPYDTADATAFAEVVVLLARSRKSVAIIDELGDFCPDLSSVPGHNARTFTIASRSAGFSMGNLLRRPRSFRSSTRSPGRSAAWPVCANRWGPLAARAGYSILPFRISHIRSRPCVRSAGLRRSNTFSCSAPP
jgi:hypothetical protein